MNVNPRFLSSNEIMEILGDDVELTLEDLNRRLDLPRQQPGELVYNTCCKLLPHLHNVILPGFERIDSEWSAELIVNSGTLWNYSRYVDLALPDGTPHDFDDDPAKHTLLLKTIEPLITEENSIWCYVERTIFFHLSKPYASLDLVMTALGQPASIIVQDPTNGPPDGLTFFPLPALGITKIITCNKDAEVEDVEGIFHEHSSLDD
jgi:hypothetical protein